MKPLLIKIGSTINFMFVRTIIIKATALGQETAELRATINLKPESAVVQPSLIYVPSLQLIQKLLG